MKIHITIAFLVCILGFYFKIRASEWLILIIWISLVLAAELINTSIEEAVNLASPQINEGARLSKDISAGAVLILATCAAISGCIIFIPKIISLLAK